MKNNKYTIKKAWAIISPNSKHLDLKRVFEVRAEAIFWNEYCYRGNVKCVRIIVEPIKRKKRVK